MTRQQFDELTAKGVVILDGATGSNLRKAGMPVGISSEQWVLENPTVLQELQRAYVDALETKIKKLAEEANSKTNATTSTTTNTTKPKTGDTNNFALWIALLFIGGGTAIGTTVVSRKKKHNR